MLVRDVSTSGSWADVRAALANFCERYEKLLATIKAGSTRTERNLVLFNLGSRAYLELDRARRLLDEPSDVLAWAARNLFEINLIVRFVLLSGENLNRWMAEMAGDERDMLLGILAISNDAAPEHQQTLRDRISEIEGILRRHNLEAKKPLQVRALASAVGMENEYEAFFKLYSKYIHPSSWLVNSPEARRDEWKGILALQAQLYGGDTFVRVRDAMGIAEDDA